MSSKPVVLRLNLPAALEYLDMLRISIQDMLENLPHPPDLMVIYQVQLAASEVYANIIEHACHYNIRQRVMVQLQVETDGRLTIEFRDSGESFVLQAITPLDPDQVAPVDADQVPERGLGLHLVRSLMDELHYQPQQPDRDFNEWRLVKQLHTHNEKHHVSHTDCGR